MNFDQFKDQYEHQPVIEHCNQVFAHPTVSVCVTAYNHANYIKECMDGILMQKTDFPFEILLGEDNSTDGTREICLEYAQLHPNKIRLFMHHRENNIRINGRFSGRFNFLFNLFSARGKYIAICEGDDYWIDPLKLQKQVDFLEKYEGYGLVFTDADVLYQSSGELVRSYDKTFKRKVPTGEVLRLLVEGNPYKTCTSMFRREVWLGCLSLVSRLPVLRVGDVPLWMYIASTKKVGYIRESTAVYRILSSSASHFTTLAQCIAFEKGKYKMKLYLVSVFRLNYDKQKQKEKVRRNVIRYSVTNNQYKLSNMSWRDAGLLVSLFIKEKMVKPVFRFLSILQ